MTQEKRVALVTGASRGIGRAIAHELGRQGRIVIGTATSDAGAEKIDADLKANGIEGAGMCLNVTDQASIDEVLKTIGERFGAPTILVNNAGITRDNLLMRMKEEEWDSVMDTNLKSVYRVSKACLRGMTKARFGRIVSISSVVATMGNLGQANYAAAKAGMEGFSRALAREVGDDGITVNCIAPGLTMSEKVVGDPQWDAVKDGNTATRAIKREQMPEDLIGTLVFFSSSDSDFITGQTLVVDGGSAMH